MEEERSAQKVVINFDYISEFLLREYCFEKLLGIKCFENFFNFQKIQ